MMQRKALRFICVAVAVGLLSVGAEARQTIALDRGWRLQSSVEIEGDGQELSEVGYDASGWYPTRVPATVLAALVDNGVYPDPYYGLNLKEIPGYVDGRWMRMPEDSPFYPPWWYRVEFDLPGAHRGKKLTLHLDGINYRANVWLNGKLIAGADEVIGMFRRFEFDVTEVARPGARNCLAVEVIAPGKLPDKRYPTKQVEATTGWDDHNPQPPDLNVGIWEDVYITATGPVRIKHPYVSADLDPPSLDLARLTVSAYVENLSHQKVDGELRGKIENVGFAKSITLAPGEIRQVEFSPAEFGHLVFKNPRLWWPNPVGPQNLYELELTFTVGRQTSDREKTTFGVRELTTYINEEGWRVYSINGHNILIRGGAWMTSDMMLNLDERRYEALIRYAHEANLNMLRSEGFSIRETDEFYELCDRYGVMVTQQIFGRSIPDEDLAVANVEDTILRIRNHPSLAHFLGHDETFPTETLDRAYRDLIEKHTPERTYQPHSGAFQVRERFETGGTRTGTLELWTHAGPAHYYLHHADGAWGFAQSGGIGGIVAPIESVRRMIPEDELWPLWTESWSFHTNIQGGHYYDKLVTKLYKRYGKANGVDEFVMKLSAMNYEAARGMYEAYARNKYSASGITTWKYDAAWPAALTWQYVDWYLLPTAAYYGAKKACEALHVQYSYDDHSVYVVNSFYKPYEGLTASARVFNYDLEEVYSESATVDVDEDGKTEAFVIKWPKGLTRSYFLVLTLQDQAGKIITDNFYWLSTRPERPGEKIMGLVPITPSSYFDHRSLNDLESVALEADAGISGHGDEMTATVNLKNPDSALAFFVNVAVIKGPGGMEVAPNYWSENYISLMPGQEKQLIAKFAKRDLEGKAPVVRVRGWNVEELEIGLKD